MSEERFSYEKECYRDEWYGYVGTYIDKEKGQYIEVPYNLVKPLVDTIMERQDLIEELYDFRLTYNALLFNEWAENQKYEVYKSRRHGDGEFCFDGEYFIVVAQLPTGQVTNHYHIRHWDMFKINEYEKVKEDFDGHTSSDVIERLQQVIDV